MRRTLAFFLNFNKRSGEENLNSQNNQKYSSGFIFEDRELKILPAVHPNNVYWKNVGISTTEKYLRRFLIYFFCAGL